MPLNDDDGYVQWTRLFTKRRKRQAIYTSVAQDSMVQVFSCGALPVKFLHAYVYGHVLRKDDND